MIADLVNFDSCMMEMRRTQIIIDSKYLRVLCNLKALARSRRSAEAGDEL